MFLAEYPIKGNSKRNYCDTCKGLRGTIPGAFVDESGFSIGWYCHHCQHASKMKCFLQLSRIDHIERELQDMKASGTAWHLQLSRISDIENELKKMKASENK